MKNFINIFAISLILFSANLSAQVTDSLSKQKVIYPIGQVSDTIKIWAAIAQLNEPVVVKEYLAITDYYVFDNGTNKQPQPFKQKIVSVIGGVIIERFNELLIWSNVIKK